MKSIIGWFDLPVRDLKRAKAFYEAVLATKLVEEYPGVAVFDHDDERTGGCLYESEEDVPSAQGALLYFDASGRLDEAAALAELQGGTVVKPPHSLGEYGRRVIVLDSEGNRIALHSER